jgi:multidrug efflux system membrane fusion protein
MISRRAIQFAVLASVSGAGFPALGCGEARIVQAADTPPVEAIPVRLGAVGRGPLLRRVRASGTVHLKSEADLSFKVGGLVTRVAADAGTRVRKGQILATVDPTEMQAGQSQTSEAVRKAERDVVRIQSLQQSGAVGTVDAQNAQTALDVARATNEAAQFNVRQTSLIAPDDGVIDRRLVEVGEVAAPGRTVFHMRGLSRGVVVRAQLADRDALQLRLGDHARVRLDARPELVLAAHVAQIATTASPATGTIEVELQLETAEALHLPSGLTAKLEIDRSEVVLASVPLAALVDGDGASAAVYVVEGERAKRVPVNVRFFAEDRAALASELPQVDSVVELGATRLEDGSLVRVTR